MRSLKVYGMGQLLQSRVAWTVAVAGVALFAVGWPLSWWFRDPTPGPDHPAVWATGFAAVVMWLVGTCFMLTLTPLEWVFGALTVRRYATQLIWAVGWLMLAVHVLIAFGIAHDWSHAEAVRHTERASGVGAGVWVNYLVLLVWGVDVIWFVGLPYRYAFRPTWMGWAVHGLLAFMAVNAAVVYATSPARWWAVGLFAWLGWDFVRWWRRRPDRLAFEMLRVDEADDPGERGA